MKEIEPYRELWKREEQDNKELREKIEELQAEIKELNDDIVWWTNRFNAVERDNERLHNIIKEVREYIKSHSNNCMFELRMEELEELLEILDKDNV